MTLTATKMKSISFCEEMFLAARDGRKTQTRRVVTPQPPEAWQPIAVEWYHPGVEDDDGMIGPGPLKFGAYDEEDGYYCRYGGPGSRLWVKEPLVCRNGIATYAADGVEAFDNCEPMRWPWKPKRLGAMYMPRRLSRLTLEITGVRVERLNEISAADVAAEGFPFNSDLDIFKATWCKLNGRDSWAANPFCWVISFLRVD